MTASYTGMNPEGTGALTDHDQLWQSVTKILTTPTGSRVMRRDFGSAIPDLLDAPQNASLTTVNVVFSETGAVTAELTGTITETMTETSNTIRLRS